MRLGRITATIGGAALLAAGWASGALAFSASFLGSEIPVGHCQGGAYADDGSTQAAAYLNNSSSTVTLGVAGGQFFLFGAINAAAPPISVATLQSCGLTNIANLSQTGAQPGDTYATASYMGYTFTATDPTDGQTYDYEFSLTGAANTVAVVTKTAHAVPVAGPGSEQVIARLQASRANALLLNQPDLIGLLDAARPSVTMGGTDAMGAMTTAMAYGPVWGRLSASWSNEGSADSRYVLGAFGAQTRLNDTAVAGVMLQFDRIKMTDAPSTAEGKGWLAGPYVVARLPDHELTFEGRALWGKTSNDISPLGTFTDSVDGTRSLVMAKVSTRVDAGPVVLRPRLSVAQVHEATDAYTDGGGAAVAKVTTTLDQVLAGVEVQKTVATAQGTLTLRGALDDVWSQSKSSLNGTAEGSRGRLTLGMTYDLGANGALAVTGFYDGIGTSDYNARGLAASYAVKF